MQAADFVLDPTGLVHPAYRASMFYPTAPEWATGEVLLASAYRHLILGIGEAVIDLANITNASVSMLQEAGGEALWSRLLTERGGLASPLRQGQYAPLSSRQLMPLVPSIGRIAGVLGKKPRNRWNPSNLLRETIGAGLDRAGGEQLLRDFGSGLQVRPDDDIFARFVEESLHRGLSNVLPAPAVDPPYASLALNDDDKRAFRFGGMSSHLMCPAERFCRDLPTLIALKESLTRRQWTALLETLLRLGLGMHALWVCNANVVLWDMVLEVASGSQVPESSMIERDIWETHGVNRPLLELGGNAEPFFKRLLERHAFARTGINLLFCLLEDAGVPWPADTPIGYSSNPSEQMAPDAVARLLAFVATNRCHIDVADAGQTLRVKVGRMFDESEKLRELADCDFGYTKNLYEFVRYGLGHVEAKHADQRWYDLGYLIAFSGPRKPLLVNPGPAMLVTLVHACCAADPSIPVSLDDFRRHLSEYGIHVPAGALTDGVTGRDLAMLGLVVDSPDAAGGRLLVRPF